MSHLKKHLMLYLGLAQLLAGWSATVDWKTLTYPAAALAVSGLITMLTKYVQNNLPDDLEPVFTPPAKPATLEKLV